MASSTTASPDASGPVDVLVVGAGPGGSAAATHLARAGHSVMLVDRAAFPRDKACSEYMSPETVRLLDLLGVAAQLEAAGAARPHGTAVVGPGGARLEGRFDRAPFRPFRPTGLSVPRSSLDHALLQQARAAGAVVCERTAVEELLYHRGAVAGAALRHPDGRRRPLRARLTIGADGLRSVVARRLGGRRHGRLRRLAFVAHVEGLVGDRAGAELHVGPSGYVGLNPIGHGLTNVALVVPAAGAAAARGRTEEFFRQSLATYPGVAGQVEGGTIAGRVLVTGPFDAWSAPVTAEGAALVGDAADFFDPFTGEGIYSALRGAELLAQVAGPALEQAGIVRQRALAPYRRARRQAFAGKWALERLIGYGMLAPRLFERAVERLGRLPGMADTLIGVTGAFVPASEVLNPGFLVRMLL